MTGISRLAKELGISTGTVSRALNGKPDVNPQTRERVLAAARKMGYAPNQAARALAQGVTGSVGFMIDLDPVAAASGDYFFMGVFNGVQEVLQAQGMDLLVLPCPAGKDHVSYLQRFVQRGVVDAMILASVLRDDPRIALLREAQVPFVTLGRSADRADYAWVDLDFEATVASSIDRLVTAGHRRIAVTVPFGEINYGYVFLDAYHRALAKAGIAFDPELVVRTERTEEAGYHAMEKFLGLADPPTAVLLMYEITAIGLYRCLAERGLKPGHDLAVIGFRDEPTIRFLTPSLTCFSVSLSDLGQNVASALLAQMPRFEAAFPPGLRQFLQPMKLREGESDRFARDNSRS